MAGRRGKTPSQFRKLIHQKKVELEQARHRAEQPVVVEPAASARGGPEESNLYQRHAAKRQTRIALLAELLDEIMSAGSGLAHAEIDANWDGTVITGRLWVDHPTEEYRFDIRFDEYGARVKPGETFGESPDGAIAQSRSIVDRHWDDCMQYLRSGFLTEVATLVAEAAVESREIAQRTKDDGLRFGRRWAVFAPREERFGLWRDVLNEGQVDDPTEISTDASSIYEAIVGEDEADSASDDEVSAFWQVASFWHVRRLPADYLAGFLEGANAAIVELKTEDSAFEDDYAEWLRCCDG